ncbi:hypothetical protein [Ulvibacter litoralis]|uniref:Tellurite resistance protein TerB n=1 Tax=Ulvibacter litoralis TaxID=227084 RepID=A0A1G7FAW0_9FLAO|nr:hypothetical protein [Ulvibacter litoralis]GHC51931.1 hypothetical protein GCM10008083_14570 [Ulvibacter litoralis]SDE73078.1 hypothetical protein SAMN05421855_102446 [Ulvibacter litoralis]
MNEFTTQWTKKELSAYLLLYCANADYIETEEEIELIRSKVDRADYKAIHKEFENDNDYQSIQKIESTIARLNLSEAQIDALIDEMKALFTADGGYDAAENALFTGLKKLLKE